MRQVSSFIPFKKEGDRLKVYLQKRSPNAERIPNYYGFWGGGLEGSETPEEALIREVREEIGIDISIPEVQLFNVYKFYKGSTKNIFLFEPKAGWEDTIKVSDDESGEWFYTEDALERSDIILEDKVVINDLERSFLGKEIK